MRNIIKYILTLNEYLYSYGLIFVFKVHCKTEALSKNNNQMMS